LRSEKLPIHGSGRQTRTFIYVDDLVEAITEVASRTGEITGEIFNLAGSETVSVLDLAQRILRSIGRQPTDYEFTADRKGQVLREEISIKKAYDVLGWKPKVHLNAGLKLTLDWLNKQTDPLCSGSSR